ncbi:MAG: extracellular solute-binding protein [Oscillospiraceae bacterium]|nr:extracellular solute-binding protein [Oscillospiraceae bacterium]
MKKLAKITAVLIILAFAVSVFAACGENAPPVDSGNVPGDLGGESVGNDEENQDEEEVKILPNLEDADFGGHIFNVLIPDHTSGDWVDWNPRDVVWSEENSGDTINDAVFARNTYLEDKYNFVIAAVPSPNNDPLANIRRAVQSNDELYDAAQVSMRSSPDVAQNGTFMNLYEVDNLDFTQPWWDQAANAALSFGNKLYYTSGDILMVNNDTCTGIVYNKDLLRDLGLDNPYPIVKEGKWTMSRLYDMVKNASDDLNGDGLMNYQDDRFGFIGQRDTLISFLHSANEYITKKDENDYPYITFGSERSYDAMNACFEIMYDRNITHNAHHIESRVPAIYPVSEEMFMDNRALFMWVRLRIVENLRSMDTDFGILPLPKLDENQDDYYTDVISHTGLVLVVPANASNPSRTGHILEAIAAESKYTTMPAYYDVTLKTKMARDDDSAEMLDIIFNNRVWDPGEYANYGGFSGDLIQLSMRDDPNIASLFERLQPRMERDIERAIERFGALD